MIKPLKLLKITLFNKLRKNGRYKLVIGSICRNPLGKSHVNGVISLGISPTWISWKNLPFRLRGTVTAWTKLNQDFMGPLFFCSKKPSSWISWTDVKGNMCLQVWRYLFLFQIPFFWWTSFSRVIRHFRVFSTKFGATWGAKYKHTHHLSQRKPSVTRSYQVLPATTFPSLKIGTHLGTHAATPLGSTKLSRFVQTSGSLVRKAPQLLPRTHGRHAREPGQRCLFGAQMWKSWVIAGSNKNEQNSKTVKNPLTVWVV